MPRPLADFLDQIAVEVCQAQRLLLLFDFDGTLVPIRLRPTECHLEPVVTHHLGALAKLKHAMVGIVSGRHLGELRQRVGLDGLVYVGNHGLEIEGPGFELRQSRDAGASEHLELLVSEVGLALTDIPGAWVEHKELTATVHYREVEPLAVPLVIETVQRVAAQSIEAGHLVLRNGRAIVEVRPAIGWNKGSAVRWLALRVTETNPAPLVLYFGDDDTDEDVFQQFPDSITVCVGLDRPTAANYWVADMVAVHSFIGWLAGLLATHK